MKLSQLIGKKWGTEIDEALVKTLTNADLVEALGEHTITSSEFVGGRARIYVRPDQTITCVTNETAEGRFVRVSGNCDCRKNEQP